MSYRSLTMDSMHRYTQSASQKRISNNIFTKRNLFIQTNYYTYNTKRLIISMITVMESMAEVVHVAACIA